MDNLGAVASLLCSGFCIFSACHVLGIEWSVSLLFALALINYGFAMAGAKRGHQ